MEKKKKGTKQAPYKMKFFRDFITSTGVSIRQIADGLSTSSSAILYWFICDDARLSKIIAVAKYLGYSVHVGFVPKAGVETPGDPMGGVFDMDDIERMHLKQTHFLSVTLREEGVTLADLARRLGISREAISYWLAKDDITIANLVRCAQVLTKDICIRFVKHEEPVGESADGAVRIHSVVERAGEWIVVPEAERTEKGPARKKRTKEGGGKEDKAASPAEHQK